MALLLVESGPLRGRRFALSEASSFVIGRDARCSLALDDPMVSRAHAVLRWGDEGWIIEDHKSLNRLFVNDLPVSSKLMRSGDSIRVGEALISFVDDGADPLLGAEVGGYRVEERLGRGSMGTVYRATQLSLDRPVALKILSDRLSSDEAFIQRFLEEARAAARLNHQNVVQVYDAGRVGDHHYISMEFLEGGTLEETLLEEGRLPPDRAIPVAIDAIEALSYAERQKIVHRDIKPANLLVDADGRVKLGDLGIALDLTSGARDGSLLVAGSPRYMAPEQARGDAVDHRADIYALGATLYRVLSGQQAYEGASVRELLAKKSSVDPEPLHRVASDVPPALSAVVHKMMARDPAARYQRAEEAREPLERSLASRPATVVRRARAARVARVTAKSPRRPGPQPGVIVISSVIVLGALLAVLYPVFRKPRPAEPASVSGTSSPGSKKAAGSARGPSARPAAGTDPASQRLAADQRSPDSIAPASSSPKGASPSLRPEEEKAPDVSDPPGSATAAATVDAGTAARIELARGQVAQLLDKGEHATAREILQGLRAGLSPALLSAAAGELLALDARIIEAEERARQRLAEARKAVRVAWTAAAALDFKRVEEALAADDAGPSASASGSGIAGGKEPASNEPGSKALDTKPPGNSAASSDGLPPGDRAALQDAAAAWRQLTEALQQKVASRETQRLAFAPAAHDSLLPPPKSFRLVALDGEVLRIEPTGGKGGVETRSVFGLEATSLTSLLAAGGAPPTPRARRGLGVLLLLTRGPERAAGLLPESDPGLGQDLDGGLGEVVALGRESAIERLEKRSGDLAAQEPPASPDAWQFVAFEALYRLGTPGQMEESRDAKGLRELYLEARARMLSGSPPSALFHAKSFKPVKPDLVQLTYDFSSEEQLRDFVAVKEMAVLAWVKARKQLRINGEVRFLKGNPFRDRLRVAAMVAPGGLDAEAPNINVALWTREGDSVTPLSDGKDLDLRRWSEGRGGGPGGGAGGGPGRGPGGGGGGRPDAYFALGMGFFLDVDLEALGGRQFGRALQGLRTFLPVFVRQPAYILLGGDEGEPLLKSRGEIVWEGASPSFGKGPVRYTIEWDDGVLRWKVNDRPVPIEGVVGLDRLKARAKKPGSITFFSMGKELVYQAIEITGALDPRWVTERCRSTAKEELDRFLAGASAERR